MSLKHDLPTEGAIIADHFPSIFFFFTSQDGFRGLLPATASSMEALKKELADAVRLQQTLGQFDLCTPNPFASEPRTPSS